MSESTSINERLVRAWGAIRQPVASATNEEFGNYRYADLASCLALVHEVCKAEGLMYVQRLHVDDLGRASFASHVVSDAGEVIDLTGAWPVCGVNANEDGPQEFASATTYAKRQLAMADWGFVGSKDDDDGNLAQKRADANAALRQADARVSKLDTWRRAVGERRSQAERLGCDVRGVDAWAEQMFGTSDVDQMDAQQVESVGRRYKQLIQQAAA